MSEEKVLYDRRVHLSGWTVMQSENADILRLERFGHAGHLEVHLEPQGLRVEAVADDGTKPVMMSVDYAMLRIAVPPKPRKKKESEA